MTLNRQRNLYTLGDYIFQGSQRLGSKKARTANSKPSDLFARDPFKVQSYNFHYADRPTYTGTNFIDKVITVNKNNTKKTKPFETVFYNHEFIHTGNNKNTAPRHTFDELRYRQPVQSYTKPYEQCQPLGRRTKNAGGTTGSIPVPISPTTASLSTNLLYDSSTTRPTIQRANTTLGGYQSSGNLASTPRRTTGPLHSSTLVLGGNESHASYTTEQSRYGSFVRSKTSTTCTRNNSSATAVDNNRKSLPIGGKCVDSATILQNKASYARVPKPSSSSMKNSLVAKVDTKNGSGATINININGLNNNSEDLTIQIESNGKVSTMRSPRESKCNAESVQSSRHELRKSTALSKSDSKPSCSSSAQPAQDPRVSSRMSASAVNKRSCNDLNINSRSRSTYNNLNIMLPCTTNNFARSSSDIKCISGTSDFKNIEKKIAKPDNQRELKERLRQRESDLIRAREVEADRKRLQEQRALEMKKMKHEMLWERNLTVIDPQAPQAAPAKRQRSATFNADDRLPKIVPLRLEHPYTKGNSHKVSSTTPSYSYNESRAYSRENPSEPHSYIRENCAEPHSYMRESPSEPYLYIGESPPYQVTSPSPSYQDLSPSASYVTDKSPQHISCETTDNVPTVSEVTTDPSEAARERTRRMLRRLRNKLLLRKSAENGKDNSQSCASTATFQCGSTNDESSGLMSGTSERKIFNAPALIRQVRNLSRKALSRQALNNVQSTESERGNNGHMRRARPHLLMGNNLEEDDDDDDCERRLH